MTAAPGAGSGGDRSGDSGLPPARILRPARPVARPDPIHTPPPAEADAPPPPTAPLDVSTRSDPDPPRRVVGPDGDPWVVEVAGRGQSGTPPDRGAPLLLLRFRPEGEHTPEEGAPLRERLVVARSLSALSESDLLTALAAATRPHFPR